MPRLFNAPAFHLDQLEGRDISELVGATDAVADAHVEMLFLQLADDEQWHRMFLDAGIGFWEVMSPEDAFVDYLDLRVVDFAKRWRLRGARIISANCRGGSVSDSVLSRFELVTSAGTLILAYADSTMKSETVVTFIS